MSYFWTAEAAEVSTKRFHLVQIEAISKTFSNGRVLRNVSLKIGHQDLVVITGPRGSGKTAVLDIIAGRVSPGSGRVLYLGQDLADFSAQARLECGIARADEIAPGFLDLTALQCVLIGAAQRPSPLYPRQGGATDRDAGLNLLELVGLEAFPDSPVASLDMLQRRRLSIAVALASRPRLLLLDDPLADLAFADRARLAALIGSIRDCGVSILLTARHTPLMLAAICDHTIALRSGECVAETGPGRSMQSPAECAVP